MKYKITEEISEDSISNLKKLTESLSFKFSEGSRARKGMNAPDIMSKYWYTKWFDWSSKQRRVFSDNFNKDYINKALQCWFLRYDANVGMLDDMNAWLNLEHSASIIAIPLNGNHDINIDGEKIIVPKGKGIVFPLNVVHSVDINPEERLWACLMFREYC